MNRNLQKFLLTLLIACQCLTMIPNPSDKVRTVHMKDTIVKIFEYMKNGHFEKFKTQDSFVTKDQKLGRCGATSGPEPWKFLGYTVAALNGTVNQSEEWSNFCFQKNSATFKWLDSTTAQIVITSSNPVVANCSDSYSLTTIFNHDIKVIETEGEHTITYKFDEEGEITMINNLGLRIIRMCDEHSHFIPDFLLTVKLFLTDPIINKLGGKIPEGLSDYIYKEHYKWLHKWEGYRLYERKIQAEMNPDVLRQIAKSGDIMCMFLGTGLSGTVMWGTGSRCSHIAMFMWGRGDESETLFVVQSNEDGIWKRPVEDFWGDHAGHSIVMLPLHPDWRAKYDTEKAWDWFETVDGQPYGYANFLFGYIDTPEENYPQITGADAWASFIMMLNDIPIIGEKAVDYVWTRALNKRLGTDGLHYKQVVLEAAKRGMTIGELAAMPEKEEWM